MFYLGSDELLYINTLSTIYLIIYQDHVEAEYYIEKVYWFKIYTV